MYKSTRPGKMPVRMISPKGLFRNAENILTTSQNKVKKCEKFLDKAMKLRGDFQKKYDYYTLKLAQLKKNSKNRNIDSQKEDALAKLERNGSFVEKLIEDLEEQFDTTGNCTEKIQLEI